MGTGSRAQQEWSEAWKFWLVLISRDLRHRQKEFDPESVSAARAHRGCQGPQRPPGPTEATSLISYFHDLEHRHSDEYPTQGHWASTTTGTRNHLSCLQDSTIIIEIHRSETFIIKSDLCEWIPFLIHYWSSLMFLYAFVNAEEVGMPLPGLAWDMSTEAWCAYRHCTMFKGMCGRAWQQTQGGNPCATLLAYQGMGVPLFPCNGQLLQISAILNIGWMFLLPFNDIERLWGLQIPLGLGG